MMLCMFSAQEGSGPERDVPTLLTVDGTKANPQIYFSTNSLEATVDGMALMMQV